VWGVAVSRRRTSEVPSYGQADEEAHYQDEQRRGHDYRIRNRTRCCGGSEYELRPLAGYRLASSRGALADQAPGISIRRSRVSAMQLAKSHAQPKSSPSGVIAINPAR
jgi:hypothetical protein